MIHLVGHTPGSIALLYDDPEGNPHIFTGDSLFPGGVGKTRSPENFTSLINDVETKIFDRLPRRDVGLPRPRQGHHPGAERPTSASGAPAAGSHGDSSRTGTALDDYSTESGGCPVTDSTTVLGVVREFSAEQGIGVIEAPETPGGCWVHYSAVAVPGYKSLDAGQSVHREPGRGQPGRLRLPRHSRLAGRNDAVRGGGACALRTLARVQQHADAALPRRPETQGRTGRRH